jgi:hypothetical protein
MWDKEKGSGCRCGGMCKVCHEDAPKTKEEKIAHLEKKEEKLQKILAKIQEMKAAVASGKEIEVEKAGE